MNPLFSQPAPGFDAPLELLAACHERIRFQCATLQKLAAHLRRQGGDEQARQAARAIVRYFDTAGKHHHEDEEQDLFPVLRDGAERRQAPALLELIAGLTAEHREMERQWSALRPLLLSIDSGQETALNAAAVDRFTALYEAHIAKEEQQLFAQARALLDQVQLDRLGQAMAARRSV